MSTSKPSGIVVRDRLLRRQRAHAVDEPAAGSHERRARVEESPLQRGEGVDVGRLDAPAGIGSSAKCTRDRCTARRSAPRRSSPVGTAARSRRRPRSSRVPQARHVVDDETEPAARTSIADDIGSGGGDRRRLATRRGAHVEDTLPRLRLDRGRHPLRRHVLHVAVDAWRDRSGARSSNHRRGRVVSAELGDQSGRRASRDS